jgi:ribosomal protein S18 acetylase RimI-like enzyme
MNKLFGIGIPFININTSNNNTLITKEYIVLKTIDNLPYIILTVACVYVFYIAYFRYKLGFWAVQPVYHNYGIFCGFRRQGIIRKELPERNKYTNFEKIHTLPYNAVLSSQPFTKNRWISLLRQHFLNNMVEVSGSSSKKSLNAFVPTEDFLLPQFQGHNSECYVSFYKEPVKKMNENTVINDEEIIGAISTRPAHIHIHNGDPNAMFDAYYVDYLCIHKSHRKKGLAAQLIQTHEYNQSYANRQISVSLFKKEGSWVKGIVPLCAYMTYGFSVKKWTKPPSLPSVDGLRLIDITVQNMNILWDFLKEVEDERNGFFDISIKQDVGNMIELVKTNNIFIKVILSNTTKVCAAYFFKKSCVLIEDTLEVLTCYASIKSSSIELTDKLFIHGFKISFWDIAAKHSFGYSAVENLSHNHIIIEDLVRKTRPSVINPCAYFFYNFAYREFKNLKKVLLLI